MQFLTYFLPRLFISARVRRQHGIAFSLLLAFAAASACVHAESKMNELDGPVRMIRLRVHDGSR